MIRMAVRWIGTRLLCGPKSRRPIMTALIVACALPLSSQLGFEAIAEDNAAAAARVAASEFDAILFDTRRDASVEAVQLRLRRILKHRIEAIDRSSGLSDAQAAKLELAGQVAIKRFLESISAQKRQFLAEPRNVKFLYEKSHAMRELQDKLRNGPFDDDSSYAKAIPNVLTPEQAATYADRVARAKTSNRIIGAENIGDLVRIAKVQKDVYQVEFDRESKYAGFLEYNKQLDIHPLAAEQPVRTFGKGKGVFGFDFGPQGDLVAIVDNSRHANVIRLSDGKKFQIAVGQKQSSVRFSPDGKTLVTAGYGTKAHLWSIATGEHIREFALDPVAGGLTPVFSPDGKLLAIGNRNSTTDLFDVASGKRLHTLRRGMSHGLSFDPSGQTLAVVYVSGNLVLWDVQTGTEKKRIQAWANELFTVDWTPDGNMLVTGGHNAPLTFWNAKDLSIAGEFESPERIISARFSPDGTRLTFAGWNASPENRYVETWAVP